MFLQIWKQGKNSFSFCKKKNNNFCYHRVMLNGVQSSDKQLFLKRSKFLNVYLRQQNLFWKIIRLVNFTVILFGPFSTTIHCFEYVSVIDRNKIFRRRWKQACTWCSILKVSISRNVTFCAVARYNVALVTCSYHLQLQTRKLLNFDEMFASYLVYPYVFEILDRNGA